MIAAIDPGAKGAIAILDGEQIIEICDLSKEPEKVINSCLVTYGVKRAVLEKVGAMPHDSKIASFSFGANVGRIKAACSLSGAEIIEVKPRVWQSWCKIYGSGDTKKLGFSLVKRVYGSELFLGPRGGLKDGRVDAVLIGLWFVNTTPN
ncbi:hypothetical protein NVP1005O_59 [Vibrio phage 1.005.O._10N.286.48.F2]|nr:hypothetical protein NVP1005O_59 [Vibrio phage 1.005.O._10N.286.48.F2]